MLYLLREQHHQEMPPVLAQVETEFSSQPLIILKLNEDNYGPFLNHSIAQTGWCFTVKILSLNGYFFLSWDI